MSPGVFVGPFFIKFGVFVSSRKSSRVTYIILKKLRIHNFPSFSLVLGMSAEILRQFWSVL